MNLDGTSHVPTCRTCGRVLDDSNLPDPDLDDGLSQCLDEDECVRLHAERMAAADCRAEERRRKTWYPETD